MGAGWFILVRSNKSARVYLSISPNLGERILQEHHPLGWLSHVLRHYSTAKNLAYYTLSMQGEQGDVCKTFYNKCGGGGGAKVQNGTFNFSRLCL